MPLPCSQLPYHNHNHTLPPMPRERRSDTIFLAVASMYLQLSPKDDWRPKKRKNGASHGKLAI